jgi:cytochrome P450
VLTAHINRLIRKLEQKSKQESTFDIGEWMRFLAFDIIGDFTLNAQFECVENQRYHPWVALLMNWFRAVSFVTNANAFGQLAPLIMLFAPIAHLKGVKDHLDISAQKVRERLAMGDDPNRNDLWTYLLRNNCDKALSLAEMEVNAALLIIAATEPLSDVLCGTIYFLALHPDILAKLRAELEGCMGPEGVLDMATTARSRYLHAVINESMRLYPPVPGGNRRKIPKEGHTVSGMHIPPDVSTLHFANSHSLGIRMQCSANIHMSPDNRRRLPTPRLHTPLKLRATLALPSRALAPGISPRSTQGDAHRSPGGVPAVQRRAEELHRQGARVRGGEAYSCALRVAVPL